MTTPQERLESLSDPVDPAAPDDLAAARAQLAQEDARTLAALHAACERFETAVAEASAQMQTAEGERQLSLLRRLAALVQKQRAAAPGPG